MSRCRFLIDECVPSALPRGLRRRLLGISVLQVGDADSPPKGCSDEDLLRFCQQEHRILITADRATIPGCVHEHLAAGNHTWGVLVLGPNTSLGLVLDDLSMIYEATQDDEWVDLLYYLPLTR